MTIPVIQNIANRIGQGAVYLSRGAISGRPVVEMGRKCGDFVSRAIFNIANLVQSVWLMIKPRLYQAAALLRTPYGLIGVSFAGALGTYALAQDLRQKGNKPAAVAATVAATALVLFAGYNLYSIYPFTVV